MTTDLLRSPFRFVLDAIAGQDEDRRRSKEAGFDLHLVKLLDPQGLQDLIARFAHQGRPPG